MENKTKVVFCLFAAAVADPLGAGAVGDGCELKKVFYLSFFIKFFLSAHNFLFPLNFFIGCFNSKLFFFSFECLFSIFKLFSNRFVLPSQWRQLLLPNWLIGSLSKMDQASSIPPCMWGLVMPPQHMGLLMKVFQ